MAETLMVVGGFGRLVSVLALSFVVGCTSVPEKEFKAYTDAFADVKTATERLILEMDEAGKIAAKVEAAASPTKPSARPFPLTVKLNGFGPSAADPVDFRRRALDVVVRYNDALVALASGKKPEEVQSSVDSLLAGFQDIAGLVGKNLPIPGGVGPLIGTVIGELEKASNRQQFFAAVRKGEPIVQQILKLYGKDAVDVYAILAADANKKSGRNGFAVTKFVRQMRSVAEGYSKAQPERLKMLEDKIRLLLDRVGQSQNSSTLATMPGKPPLDELAFSQLDQTLVQAEAAGAEFTATIEKQVAYHALIVSYGTLLSKTSQTLTNLRLALDQPADIRKLALDLVAVSFDVKRKLAAVERSASAAKSN